MKALVSQIGFLWDSESLGKPGIDVSGQHDRGCFQRKKELSGLESMEEHELIQG